MPMQSSREMFFSTACWAYVQSWTLWLCHAAQKQNGRSRPSAVRLPLRYLELGVRTLLGFLWAPWPPRQCLLSSAAWTCFTAAPGLMKHPNYRASFSQVLLSVSHFMFMATSPPPCVAIKSSYWIVYSWLTWGAHGRDKTFIMSPYQR